MISLDLPGFGKLDLKNLVADYNGTLALDGRLLPGVADSLSAIASTVNVHVITADTFGLAQSQLKGLPVSLTITAIENQDETKLEFISKLGASSTAAMGNGRNNRKMLEAAALGITLIQQEGGSAASLACADIPCTSIHDARALLQHPKRLTATLRSGIIIYSDADEIGVMNQSHNLPMLRHEEATTERWDDFATLFAGRGGRKHAGAWRGARCPAIVPGTALPGSRPCMSS